MKRRLAASAVTAAILMIGGASLASAPANAATGGGCGAYAQVTACVSEDSWGDINADAYVNGGYAGCWVDIKLYDSRTWYILNEQGYDCSNGGHHGPIGININVPTNRNDGYFVTYATLNNGAASSSPELCAYC
jgi:hypothetical protein